MTYEGAVDKNQLGKELEIIKPGISYEIKLASMI
jgi:hypothetical protein